MNRLTILCIVSGQLQLLFDKFDKDEYYLLNYQHDIILDNFVPAERNIELNLMNK